MNRKYKLYENAQSDKVIKAWHVGKSILNKATELFVKLFVCKILSVKFYDAPLQNFFLL